MKPFNLEEAKAGKPLMWHEPGLTARAKMIAYTPDLFPDRPVVVWIEGVADAVNVTAEGTWNYRTGCLSMAVEKRPVWVNLYSYSPNSTPKKVIGYVHPSEQVARSVADLHGGHCIATVKVEWEE